MSQGKLSPIGWVGAALGLFFVFLGFTFHLLYFFVGLAIVLVMHFGARKAAAANFAGTRRGGTEVDEAAINRVRWEAKQAASSAAVADRPFGLRKGLPAGEVRSAHESQQSCIDHCWGQMSPDEGYSAADSTQCQTSSPMHAM